ncbi:hypothetical protein P3X46_023447 [Hevea brasiliensis]|uniref:Cytochrome P450 n=1 Tax=Hevea brasiliensis TaxID=3981 RepID=A0ABQ9LB31_HEVBR|nr:cytochrome P450 71A1-like [Hevea brasiliensis]KAJ9163818.1 hypothetical protein P3X46_023447 [Hevea brasiliensis]
MGRISILPFLQQILQELHGRVVEFNPSLFSLFVLLFLLFWHKFTGGGKHKKSPPSPPKLPIIGNLHQQGKLPHRSFHAFSKKYGPLMFLQMGHTKTLVVSSAEAAREMMKAHDIIFSNRPRTTAANIFLYGCLDIGFAPYGEYWRQVKKLGVIELLSLRRVQSFQFVREEEVAILLDKLRGACVAGATVNLSEMLLSVSNNIASRCVIGRRADDEAFGKSKFGELSRRIMVQFTDFSFGDTFPLLGWMDYLTGLIPRLKLSFREMDAFLDQVIEEHRILESDDPHHLAKKDFVDILLSLQKNCTLDFQLTPDKLKAVLMDMFVGGTDTTSTTMEWLMAELIKDHKVMRKAQEEVRRIVGKKLKLEATDVDQMNYLKCIIKEALRLHPPAPLMVPRETSEIVELGGYEIPPKTTVHVNLLAIQTDPKIWDRAEEFLPERFENNPVDFKGQNFQFLPFGGGRRGCPGMAFGVASAEFVIANLLYWFDWKLPALDKDLDMTEVFGLTVHKKIPLRVAPTLYSP